MAEGCADAETDKLPLAHALGPSLVLPVDVGEDESLGAPVAAGDEEIVPEPVTLSVCEASGERLAEADDEAEPGVLALGEGDVAPLGEREVELHALGDAGALAEIAAEPLGDALCAGEGEPAADVDAASESEGATESETRGLGVPDTAAEVVGAGVSEFAGDGEGATEAVMGADSVALERLDGDTESLAPCEALPPFVAEAPDDGDGATESETRGLGVSDTAAEVVGAGVSEFAGDGEGATEAVMGADSVALERLDGDTESLAPCEVLPPFVAEAPDDGDGATESDTATLRDAVGAPDALRRLLTVTAGETEGASVVDADSDVVPLDRGDAEAEAEVSCVELSKPVKEPLGDGVGEPEGETRGLGVDEGAPDTVAGPGVTEVAGESVCTIEAEASGVGVTLRWLDGDKEPLASGVALTPEVADTSGVGVTAAEAVTRGLGVGVGIAEVVTRTDAEVAGDKEGTGESEVHDDGVALGALDADIESLALCVGLPAPDAEEPGDCEAETVSVTSALGVGEDPSEALVDTLADKAGEAEGASVSVPATDGVPLGASVAEDEPEAL